MGTPTVAVEPLRRSGPSGDPLLDSLYADIAGQDAVLRRVEKLVGKAKGEDREIYEAMHAVALKQRAILQRMIDALEMVAARRLAA